MAWDANWATSGAMGKLPLNALNQLRAGLLERYAVCAFATSYGAYVPALLTSGQRVPTAWFANYQILMSAMFGNYADHTQATAGSFSGMATIPKWTEANILTAIGDASRCAAPATGRLLAAWCIQQYKLVNMLRWTYHQTPTGGSGSASNTEYRRGTDASSFANAATAYAAASWVSGTGTLDSQFDDNLISALSYWATNSPYYRIQRHRSQPQINTWTTGTKDVDFYYYCQSPGGSGWGSAFNANGDSITSGQYYRDPAGMVVGATTATVQAAAKFPTQTSTPGYGSAVAGPGSPVNEGYRGYVSAGKPLVGVAKHDVVGGFAYKDW